MSRRKYLFYIALALVAVIVGAASGIVAVHMSGLPEISALGEYRPSATTRVFADDGELIAEFYMENRTPVTLDKVPKSVINAFLAVEDPRFYSHSGIDFYGIARAMLKNIRARRIVQGGSTITQQLAKLLFLEPEKTYSRKIKEALLAMQIERRYSKGEILAFYLNQVYLGSGAYGIEAAAHIYFGKTADKLTLAEGAMLAGLPAAPNKYSPLNNPERAAIRRRHVLTRMYVEGFISAEEMQAADKEPIVTHPARFFAAKAPYFVEYIRQRLEEKYGPATLYKGGLNVYTTLNARMQDMAEAAVQKGLAAVHKRHPRKNQEIQGALLAIEPHSGSIRAMVGGTDFTKSQFNRCTQALRQPGSAFKPFVYATAVENGYTPESVIDDSPVSYPGSRPGERWSPGNFDERFEGPVTLRKALAKSINVVAVKLLDKVGVQPVIDCARRLGITTPLSPYLSLALGASDATLIEMTSAFAAFDNSGVYTAPVAIEKITDREGMVLEETVPAMHQAVSQEAAASMTDLLQGVVQFGTGWQAKSLGRPAAGKTGTTSEFNDAWFIGYLPSMVAGVWVGYDDHKPIGNRETGAAAALPIWLEFMQGYIKEFKVPPDDFPKPPERALGNMTGLAAASQNSAPAEEEKPEEAPMDEAPADGTGR